MRLLILEQPREPENQVFKTVGARHGIAVVIVDPVHLQVSSEMSVTYQGQLIEAQFDALAIRSYRRFSVIREVGRVFASAGKPVFGLKVDHPAFCQDKYSDILDLQRAMVPVPATWSEPVPALHEEVVMKENWGYGGHGVSKVSCRQLPERDPYGVHFQEYLPAMHDWRVLLCEGTALPWIVVRTPEAGDFRTNTHQGGAVAVTPLQDFDLGASLVRLAENAGRVLGRDCAGVDLREAPGGPVVLEVNRTPRLRLGEMTEEIVQAYLLAWQKALN